MRRRNEKTEVKEDVFELLINLNLNRYCVKKYVTMVTYGTIWTIPMVTYGHHDTYV